MKRRFYLLLLVLPIAFLDTEAQSVSPLSPKGREYPAADASVQSHLGRDSGFQQKNVVSQLNKFTDSLSSLQQLPRRYFARVSSKANQFNGRITKRTEKALRRLQKQEEKINSKLSKIDSVTAKGLALGRSVDSISHLEDLIKGKAGKLTSKIPGSQVLLRAGKYIPRLDSIQTSLKFLNKYNSQLSQLKSVQQKLQGSLKSVQQLEGRLQQVQNVQQYIQQQQQVLTQALSRYGNTFAPYLGSISKQAYYYRAQVANYEELWSHPDQVEAKAMELLNKVPAFTQFMKEHSMIAGLFAIPTGYGQSVAGLQTRAMVERQIQQQLQTAGPNGRQLISQQMQQAKDQLQQLQNKFPGLDNAAQMPNFRPKELKSKTFLQRVQLGANIQFAKSSQYFPTSSDIALQAAYQFTKNGSAGLGAAYKLGLGNIHKIRFTSQGLGLRSFMDYKIKGTIYANGGFEYNYNKTIPDIQALKNWNGWTRSALLGIEKKYKISDKVSGNLLLLYDFLYNQHTPTTQPLVFRMGYNF